MQAPQLPFPQPSFVPVKFKSSLRSSSKVSRGSHRNSDSSPLIVVVTCVFAIVRIPLPFQLHP